MTKIRKKVTKPPVRSQKLAKMKNSKKKVQHNLKNRAIKPSIDKNKLKRKLYKQKRKLMIKQLKTSKQGEKSANTQRNVESSSKINISSLKTLLNKTLNNKLEAENTPDEKNENAEETPKEEDDAKSVDAASSNSLRDKMRDKLKAARFRYLNEQIYTTTGENAQKLFQDDPESFKAYHEGYKQQVAKWPINPLDVIIASIKKMSKKLIVADFGCGEARLAESVPQKVHSLDLVASAPEVVACDMAHTSLPRQSVDVVVFCLSLMGTNLQDFILEANRVLRPNGVLKVAEVESRFDNVEDFIKGLEYYGFTLTWKDISCNLFYFLDFKKQKTIKVKSKLPTISLHPCLYKKR